MTSLQIVLASLSYGFTIFTLAFLALRVRTLIAFFKGGQPDPTRNNEKGSRLRHMLIEVFGHTKMLNFSVTGVAHWFVMIGFGALFGTLVTAYGQLISPSFALPLIGHFIPYEFMSELIAWLTGISIIALIGIRQVTRMLPERKNRFAGSNMGRAYYVEITILIIVFAVIALRGLEGALAGEESWNWHYALSWPAVVAFGGLSTTTIETLIFIIAAVKILTSMLWFVDRKWF